MPTISVAQRQDIPALCNLLDALFAQEREFFPDSRKQQAALDMLLANPQSGFILVARDGQQPIAMLSVLFTLSTFMGGRVGMVEDVIVAAAHRRAGLGSALLAAAEYEAQARGCLRLTLLTDDDNASAQNFYRQRGFNLSTMRVLRKTLL